MDTEEATPHTEHDYPRVVLALIGAGSFVLIAGSFAFAYLR